MWGPPVQKGRGCVGNPPSAKEERLLFVAFDHFCGVNAPHYYRFQAPGSLTGWQDSYMFHSLLLASNNQHTICPKSPELVLVRIII